MIAGDSVYGADSAIRRWAERHRRGYVLAVTSGQRLGMRPVTTWVEDLPADEWQRLSAGDGAKGPRMYDWAHVPYRGAAEGFTCALLVRRSISDPQEAAFYLTHAPDGTGLAELVRVAGRRWAIESLFEQAKGEIGLDHYEGWSWIGWHRHITLSMLALAYLAAVRKGAAPPAALLPAASQTDRPEGDGYGPSKPHRGPAAAHRARGQAAAGRTRARATIQTRGRPALVNLATTAPATRTTRTLAAANTGTLE